jgi:hypothetical protein
VAWDNDKGLLRIRDAYVVNEEATLKKNAALRKDAGRGSVSQRVSNTDDLVATSKVNRDVILHRGSALPDSVASEIVPGLRLTDHGFQSSALDVQQARTYVSARAADLGGDQTQVMYRILAPAGTPAVNVGQAEVVLARGTSMEILSARTVVEDGARIRYVDARIVND